jgi:hypothetical protein
MSEKFYFEDLEVYQRSLTLLFPFAKLLVSFHLNFLELGIN